MNINAQEIFYLSAAYKNMCECKCPVPACMEKVLQTTMYQNVLQASFRYNQELNQRPNCNCKPECKFDGKSDNFPSQGK